MSLSIKYRLHNHVRKNGKSNVYMHIHGDSRRIRLKTEVECLPNDWSNVNERIKPSALDSEPLNLILDNLDAKVTKIKISYHLTDMILTPEKLVEELSQGSSRSNFILYMEKRIDSEGPTMSEGYLKRCKKVLNKLRKFKEPIFFHEIDHSLFQSYRDHCGKKGNSKATIAGNIAIIKKFLKQAKQDGVRFNLDLETIKRGSMKGNRIDLHPKDLKTMHDYFFSPFINPEWKLLLGYFLFSCFTSIRWSQVMELNRSDILGRDVVNFYVRKNQRRHSIAFNKTTKRIVQEEERLFTNKITEQYMNRELKKIASSLGIKRKISFHVARHTFATNFLRAGGNVVKLQKIMGHTKLDTTMIYVHIVEQEAHSEMALMDNLF